MTFIPYSNKLKTIASQLRTDQTETELLFWSRLRKKQILGIQFYRQKVIGNYIIDFYAPTVKLVIEIDGSQHFESEMAIQKDLSRDTYLKGLGLTVLRFDNYQIGCFFDDVMEEVYEYVEDFLG
ncbi:MAG: endonuclease domain-containing protein [Candidatus Berkiellales bacterium]